MTMPAPSLTPRTLGRAMTYAEEYATIRRRMMRAEQARRRRAARMGKGAAK